MSPKSDDEAALVKQRIIISGLGGQGVLTLTRILAEAADARGEEVITSETHGMAQRGGTVISMIKVGPFRGPLIAPGGADLGLFLHAANLPVHRTLLRAGAPLFVNSPVAAGEGIAVDAAGLAAGIGSAVTANLVLLGFAAGSGALFSGPGELEEVIRRITPERYLDLNLRAFASGREAAAGHGG